MTCRSAGPHAGKRSSGSPQSALVLPDGCGLRMKAQHVRSLLLSIERFPARVTVTVVPIQLKTRPNPAVVTQVCGWHRRVGRLLPYLLPTPPLRPAHELAKRGKLAAKTVLNQPV